MFPKLFGNEAKLKKIKDSTNLCHKLSQTSTSRHKFWDFPKHDSYDDKAWCEWPWTTTNNEILSHLSNYPSPSKINSLEGENKHRQEVINLPIALACCTLLHCPRGQRMMMSAGKRSRCLGRTASNLTSWNVCNKVAHNVRLNWCLGRPVFGAIN